MMSGEKSKLLLLIFPLKTGYLFCHTQTTKARWNDKFQRAFFYIMAKVVTFWQVWPQNDPKTIKRLRPDGWIFQPSGRFLWIKFAELAGKNRIGQRGQLALASTSTLFCGTTICSCFVGMGGFLYWRIFNMTSPKEPWKRFFGEVFFKKQLAAFN